MLVNPEVPPDSLPGARDLAWRPLHPRFARRLQLGALLRAILIAALWGATHHFGVIGERVPWIPPLVWTIVGVFALWSCLWPLISVPRRGYIVREKDILYRSGVLWRSVRTFPFNRVQHTRLDSTPLDRWFGLASVSVFPAGAHSGQRIRGFSRTTAERLRIYISERIDPGTEGADEWPATADASLHGPTAESAGSGKAGEGTADAKGES